MTERVILHVDLNCFFASVETVLNPALRGRAIAVCGSREDRHGIVLAKSEVAKRAGVKTGMTNGEAQRLCPGLLILPPQYRMYQKFSRLAKQIYLRYSDRVEPFGLDENWIDLTGSMHRFESAFSAAEEIRTTVSRELGLTVSVGVSFNKIFAKLGSDMKKPDATTLITRDNYRETAWKLPVSDLLFVGRASARKLNLFGIRTIGDLATADEGLCRTLLGKNGAMLREFALGHDTSPVMKADTVIPPKSIGHGITCNADVNSDEEVARIFLELAQDVGRQLRRERLWASGIQIAVRDRELVTRQLDTLLPWCTQSARDLAEAGYRLYLSKYKRERPIRSLTIRATRLSPSPSGDQMGLFYDYARIEREARLEHAMDDITSVYGTGAIYPASLLLNTKTRSSLPYVSVLPHSVFNER